MKVLLITNGSSYGSSSSWTLFTKFINYFKQNEKNDVHIIRFSPDWKRTHANKNETIYSIVFFSSFIVSLLSKLFSKYLFYISTYYSKKYSNNIVEYIKNNKIEKIWVYCDILPVNILSEILKIENIDYHLSVFDNPFSVNYSISLKKKLSPIFKNILNNSSIIDFTVPELYKQITIENGLNYNKPYTFSMAGVFKHIESLPIINKDVKRICLAGSVFGIDALNEFLSSCSEIMTEMSIQFDIYSTFSKYHISYINNKFPLIRKNINFFDLIDENKIVYKLQTYDLLYLPLYFGEEKLNQSMSSFPSKLHNYISSGVPIIFHVPKHSALYNYASINKIGFIITSLDKNEILNEFVSSLEYANRISINSNILDHNRNASKNEHLNKLQSLIFNNLSA